MTQVISTNSVFNAAQQATISALADLMIPAGDGMPSAADPAICRPALAGLSPHAESVGRTLHWLDEFSQQQYGESFTALSSTDQQTAVVQLKQQQPSFTALLQTHIIACYYRDDRVLTALGLPARAPFPDGNTVAPTDWSLLDRVRERAPFYREV